MDTDPVEALIQAVGQYLSADTSRTLATSNEEWDTAPENERTAAVSKARAALVQLGAIT